MAVARISMPFGDIGKWNELTGCFRANHEILFGLRMTNSFASFGHLFFVVFGGLFNDSTCRSVTKIRTTDIADLAFPVSSATIYKVAPVWRPLRIQRTHSSGAHCKRLHRDLWSYSYFDQNFATRILRQQRNEVGLVAYFQFYRASTLLYTPLTW